MLAETERLMPQIDNVFPGFEERAYFVHPETGEFWFHAANVCRAFEFSNPSVSLGMHCDEDERLMEIVAGKATWFVSESGCYGLAFVSKSKIAKDFKRWLKHDLLPTIRRKAAWISDSATLEQIREHQAHINQLEKEKSLLEEENGRLEARVELLDDLKNETICKFRRDLALILKPKMKCSADDFEIRVLAILDDMHVPHWTVDGYKYSYPTEQHYRLTDLMKASRSALIKLSPASVKSFDERFNAILGY